MTLTFFDSSTVLTTLLLPLPRRLCHRCYLSSVILSAALLKK